MESGRTATALADHPAILTFQPECIDAQTLTGEVAGDRMRIQVVLSPFAMQVEFYGYNFTEPMELLRSTTLVFRDGTAVTADQLTSSLGGGAGASSVDGRRAVRAAACDQKQVPHPVDECAPVERRRFRRRLTGRRISHVRAVAVRDDQQHADDDDG